MTPGYKFINIFTNRNLEGSKSLWLILHQGGTSSFHKGIFSSPLPREVRVLHRKLLFLGDFESRHSKCQWHCNEIFLRVDAKLPFYLVQISRNIYATKDKNSICMKIKEYGITNNLRFSLNQPNHKHGNLIICDRPGSFYSICL